MEIPSATWWSEMETTNMNDHPLINHHSFNDQLPNYNKQFHSSCTYKILEEKPAVFCSSKNSAISYNHFENMNTSLVKTEVPLSRTTINFTSSISCSDSDFDDSQHLIKALGFGDTVDHKKSYNRTALQAQDHAVAERKRRERLTQRFIALSTLIPNLKKLDKASVLGDAIKYIKQLEEQVKILEEKSKKSCIEEPAVKSMKRARTQYTSNYEEYSSSSSDGNSSISNSTDPSILPDIEVRASDGNIMIRIYCNKQSGIIKEIFSQVEKLHLSIISSTVMPFGCNTTHITIIAEMDHKLRMTPNDVANRIRASIIKEEASSLTA